MTGQEGPEQIIFPLRPKGVLPEAQSIIRQEAETLVRLSESLDQSFCDAIELIRSRPGV